MLILAISPWVIGMYRITSETAAIAAQLMRAVSITVIFMMTGGILTKGILRSGGDTRFLMIADILFLWVFSAWRYGGAGVEMAAVLGFLLPPD